MDLKLDRKRGILLVAAAAAAVAVGFWLWPRSEPPPLPDGPSRQATAAVPESTGPLIADPPPALPASPYANMTAKAEYVGADACIECHEDEHDSYLQTAHSRSFGDVDPATEPPDGQFQDAGSGRSYRVYRQADRLRHRETFHSPAGKTLELADYPLRYVVGSGMHARTYLVESNGYLFESPLTWYAIRKQWALSPAYDRINAGFSRPVYYDCLFCHTGRVEAVDGNRHRLSIHVRTIDCERCHGPGSLHVARWEGDSNPADESDVDATIVNPASLPRESRESICTQCHLHGAAEVEVRGRSIRDFRPGAALSDVRICYVQKTDGKAMHVTGHGEQMRASVCYQKSQELTCTTCHDMHRKPAKSDRIAWYRAKCLTCHSQQACAVAPGERARRSPGDDCTTCHMPSTATEVSHVAATHHRIGIHAAAIEKGESSNDAELVPLDEPAGLSETDRQRNLGLAYLQLTVQTSDAARRETYRRRSRDLLREVRAGGLRDPYVDSGLARLLQGESPSEAIELAQTALRYESLSADVRTEALFTLSNASLARQQTAQAGEALAELVQMRRRASDWFALGVCKYQSGDVDGALQAVQQAAEIAPERPEHHALLAELFQRAGQPELARQHVQEAQLLSGANAGRRQ